MPPVDCTELPPEAVIKPLGRWWHLVYITYTPSVGFPMVYGPDGYGWHVFGARRAERKARRVLRRYLAMEERRARAEREKVTIRADEVQP